MSTDNEKALRWLLGSLILVLLLVSGWLHTEQVTKVERLQGELVSASKMSFDHERRLVALEVRFEEIVKKLDEIHCDVKAFKEN